MQSPPFPRYLITPTSKYSQHHILKHPQLSFLPCCQRPDFKFSLIPCKSLSSSLNRSTFEVSFQIATSICHLMRPDIAEDVIISPILFSLYVNDMPSPSHHSELALYMDNTAVIATSCQPTLLVKYLETYLRDLDQWLSEWRILINVLNHYAMLFIKASRHIPKH